MNVIKRRSERGKEKRLFLDHLWRNGNNNEKNKHPTGKKWFFKIFIYNNNKKRSNERHKTQFGIKNRYKFCVDPTNKREYDEMVLVTRQWVFISPLIVAHLKFFLDQFFSTRACVKQSNFKTKWWSVWVCGNKKIMMILCFFMFRISLPQDYNLPIWLKRNNLLINSPIKQRREK